MSRTGDRDTVPRAMVHRRILDVAAADADASMEAIADEVSGASVELVERVLDEYGDPADGPVEQEGEAASGTDGVLASNSPTSETTTATPQDPPSTAESASGATTDASGAEKLPMSQNGPEPAHAANDTDEALPEWGDLSEKQRTTLRAVHENPDAPQEAIADELGVTRATVSRRLSDVPGFEWDDREAFVRALLGDSSGTDVPDGDDRDASANGADVEATLDHLERRVETLENRENEQGHTETGDVSSVPPDLAHRVVHACMESDRISEEEELTLLRAFM